MTLVFTGRSSSVGLNSVIDTPFGGFGWRVQPHGLDGPWRKTEQTREHAQRFEDHKTIGGRKRAVGLMSWKFTSLSRCLDAKRLSKNPRLARETGHYGF
jgi:hypothetical protein